MELRPTPIFGAFEIVLTSFEDERGKFTKFFGGDELKKIGISKPIVQINHSINKIKGTLRGMHFQNNPYPEFKIIHCLRGKVYDVMVDLRTGSPSFLQWFAVELTTQKNNMVFIPQGCAHGFQTLENDSELLYMHSNIYHKACEGGVMYNDPQLGIDWPLPPINISQKDTAYPLIDNGYKGLDIPLHQ